MAFGQQDEARLVEALRKNDTAFIPELSIVALINNHIVGHILFTKIYIEETNGNQHESLALAPVSVKPDFQRKGIGTQLIEQGLHAAKAKGFKSVIVLGHETYYPKFGFEPAHKWGIKAPFDVSANSLMAVALTSDGLKQVSGTVIYTKEFENL